MANDIAKRDDNYQPALIGIDENTGEIRAVKVNANGELLVTGTVTIADNTSVQKINVEDNGTLEGTRSTLNLIPGSNVTLTVSDNAIDDRVDVTIASTSGGNVSKVGTPVNNQVAVWTGSSTIRGDVNLTFNTITDTLTTTNIVGALTGNASTATALQTARNINGTSFNGTADITVTADAGTLTGTTLNATVVTSSLTSVGTLVSGNATAIVDSASTTAQGKVELAVASEVNTGTSDSLAITPDSLAGSYAGTKSVSIQVTGGTTAVTTGDGKAYITIPESLNGMNLIRAQATVVTAGTTNATTVMIHNKTDAVDMLSGAISIASGGTVGTVGTINTSTDDVATNDVIRIDVDAVSTTAPQGLMVILEFRLP